MMTFFYPVFFLEWTFLGKTESWLKQSIYVYSSEILLPLEPDLLFLSPLWMPGLFYFMVSRIIVFSSLL